MLSKEVLARIRRIHLHTRFLVRDAMMGEYQSSFKGQGMEFEEVREYLPGDDVRHIDWNVTARSGFPHIKKFREERELTVFIAVDMSASGSFGTYERFKREIAAELAAAIAYLAIQNSDKVGVILFSDTVERFVPPQKGRNHVLRVIREVLAFEPQGRGTNLNGVIEFLGRVARRRAVVFLVSDFFAEGYERSLTLLARKHDLVAISVRDKMERDLPDAGIFECEDPETGERIAVDLGSLVVRKAFAQRAEADETALTSLLRRSKVERISVRTEESYLNPLVAFFMRRSRRRALKLLLVLMALGLSALVSPCALAEMTLRADLSSLKGSSADLFHLNVEATADSEGPFAAPDVAKILSDQKLRVVRVRENPPSRRDSRWVQSWVYDISADAPGVYEIPPLEWKWKGERRQSSRISFDVVSVLATPLAGKPADKPDILDIKPIYEERWPYRYLVIVVVGVIAALAGLVYFFWLRKGRLKPRVKPEVVLSSQERAIAALRALEIPRLAGLDRATAEHLASQFHLQLGAILKLFLEEKGVENATDRTSEELRDLLLFHPVFASQAGREYASEIRLHLQESDAIKFARDLPGESQLSDAKLFVERLIGWCVEREAVLLGGTATKGGWA